MGIWVDLSVDCFLQKSSVPLIFFNFELEHDDGPGFTTLLALFSPCDLFGQWKQRNWSIMVIMSFSANLALSISIFQTRGHLWT